MKKIFLISAISILASGYSAYATLDGTGEKKKGLMGKQLGKFDGNKDGIITREESRSANDKMFDTIDANKDDKITKEERDAFRAKRKAEYQEKRKEFITKYDTDKDGKLSPTERQAIKADMKNKNSVTQ